MDLKLGQILTIDGVEAVIMPLKADEGMCIAGHDEAPFCHADREAVHDIIGDRTCHEGIAAIYEAIVEEIKGRANETSSDAV